MKGAIAPAGQLSGCPETAVRSDEYYTEMGVPRMRIYLTCWGCWVNVGDHVCNHRRRLAISLLKSPVWGSVPPFVTRPSNTWFLSPADVYMHHPDVCDVPDTRRIHRGVFVVSYVQAEGPCIYLARYIFEPVIKKNLNGYSPLRPS